MPERKPEAKLASSGENAESIHSDSSAESLKEALSPKDSSLHRILILTASFGEGHNAAARNLVEAFQGKAEVLLADPCMEAKPKFNKRLSQAYQGVITHTPTFWAALYYGTDLINLNKPSKLLTRKPEETTHAHIRDFKPDAIISTYPLYPYYVERSFRKLPRVPVFTVITDSIKINKTWTAAPTDYFLVTDDFTKEILTSRNKIPADKIEPTGFPVNPVFATQDSLTETDSCKPFKILYFATGQKPQIRRNMRALLQDENANIELTVVLAKNVRKLYSRAQEVKTEFPTRVKIKGWTRKVPELMASHHLVVGKAGGATSHEALSAGVPMLIHYLLPGQEEGNLQLLQKIGGGALAISPSALKEKVAELLEDDAKLWRQMKQNLLQHRKPEGAKNCADFVLRQLSK